MELIAIAFFGFLALWFLLGGNNSNTPPEGFAPTSPDASGERPRTFAVPYWDERGDPPTADERIQAYLAQCTASRPCVATSDAYDADRYDVDSYAAPRRTSERPLLRDAGIPVDNWPHRQRQRERAERRR